jgi:hypothetical protein
VISDVDLVVFGAKSSTGNPFESLYVLADALYNSQLCWDYPKVILTAKVFVFFSFLLKRAEERDKKKGRTNFIHVIMCVLL